MSGSKHLDRIAGIVTAITLAITILFMNGTSLGIRVMAHTMGYEDRLFDNTKVHTIDIVMNDWDDFINNATSEEYYAASVVIDGESYKNVGIRAKGNTSLSTVASLGSERYSFKIEFDHYDKTKSYHGLDKLSLNNLIQDSTMMKDYLTYTLMNEFGVDSSLCSYVYITVNGEDWGLYLAVEGVEESFLERNYGSDYGELYKPDSMSFGGGRGNGKDFDMGAFDIPNSDEYAGSTPSDNFASSSKGDNGETGKSRFGGESGMGSSDVKLQYIDDEISSYSNIWNNAKTDITESDQTRLIESLKKLSNNEDISSVVDVEQVIRYFVVHNYVCNGDSYTGSMIHNYYLYEKDGKLAMIPWDYNLAYGTFQGGNADSTVNTPIDAPLDNGSNADRPMWNWIVANEEYTQLYHQYFAEFLNSIDIDRIIENAYALIKDDVAKDPTAFYSYAAFELGVETLRQFCTLRSESISMQLENNETAENQDYVDASAIMLSDMGSMGGGMGGGGGDMPSMPNSNGQAPGNANNATDENPGSSTTPSSDATDGNTPPDMPSGSPGKLPDGFDASDLPEDFDPSSIPGGGDGNAPGQSSGNETEDVSVGESDTNRDDHTTHPGGGDMQMPADDVSFDPSRTGSPETNRAAWIWIAVSVGILAIGLIVAKKYKG